MAAARMHLGSGGDGDGGDGATTLVLLSVLHDLLGVAVFLATHPLHAAYLLFFSRHLLPLLAFFSPLLLSTLLLLAVLVTAAPYVGAGRRSAGMAGMWSLGRTCGIAVAALRTDLLPERADGDKVAALVGQLCSFVLGPGDAAAVVRVGEIMGELCDIGASCFLLDEKEQSFLPLSGKHLAAPELTWQDSVDAKIFMNHEGFDETKDGIEEKNVVLEDFKVSLSPDSLPENCSRSASATSAQEMEEDVDGSSESDGAEEKRLECDPVSVETSKCEPVKPHSSSISRRIKLWEAQASGNFLRVLDDVEENSVELCLEKGQFEDVNEFVQLETEDCGGNLQTEEVACIAESEIEFKDVKECVRAETEDCTVECSKEHMSDETAFAAQPEMQELQEEKFTDVVLPAEPDEQDLVWEVVELTEQELREQEYRVVQPQNESEEQDNKGVQRPEQESQEEEENEVVLVQAEAEQVQELEEQYNDAEYQEPAANSGEDPLMSTSIAGRVHSRNSSENVVGGGGEGSPRKDKEWKRTLACKLYEERMQHKLCRDRAVVEGSDNMDMLWEAYESGSGGGASAAGNKARRRGKQVGEGEQEEVDEEEEEEEDEGSVRQLCCLQALKFSTRKMSFGGGKPSLGKIAKVLKRMTALSRTGSRRNLKP